MLYYVSVFDIIEKERVDKMDETQSKDYSKLWVNIVATLMCGSVLAVIFARILRFFNFNTLIKSGIFTVLLLALVILIVLVFFLIRKIDIEYELEPDNTAKITLAIMSVATLITVPIVFFYPFEWLLYVLAIVYIVCIVILCITQEWSIKVKLLIALVCGIVMWLSGGIACKSLEFTVKEYLYFTDSTTAGYNTVNNTNTDNNERFFTVAGKDECFYWWQSMCNFYAFQDMTIGSVQDLSMFNASCRSYKFSDSVYFSGLERYTDYNLDGSYPEELIGAEEYFTDNSLFVIAIKLQHPQDRVEINDLILANGMASLDYTYYDNYANKDSIQNDNNEFSCVLAVLEIDKENEKLIQKSANLVDELTGEIVNGRKNMVCY